MKSNLRKLAAYYKPYLGLFWADMFFAMLGALVSLVIPLMVRYIISNISDMSSTRALQILIKIGITMVLLVLVQFGSRYFITYYGHVMGAYIERDMRAMIFEHYQKLSFAFYDDQKVGALLSRITSDLFDITELLHHGPEDLAISAIKLVGALCILGNINFSLAMLCLLVVVIMFLFAFFYNRKMKNAFVENRRRMADINSQIEDSLAGIRVVKSFGNEKGEIEKFQKTNKGFVKSKKLTYRYMGTYYSVMDAFTTFITVVTLLGGAAFMVRGQLRAVDLVTFLLYINNFTEPVTKLVNFTETFQNGYSGYCRFLEIMAIEPDIRDAEDAMPLKKAEGEIIFDNVSFCYRQKGEEVLSHVNLQVDPGEYVAIVGSSGVGKTTLCSLIPRFYEVSDGCVKLDGKDIRKIRLEDLRRQIGIVQQDVYLFAGTIFENISYGKPGAGREEVIQAAISANAHDFIMGLPDGYDTDIGQRGVKLSGGQKQRLSIARVFLKNPPVLIFDEATSSLDNESEKIVQNSLEKLAHNRTTFVIAHRLSTIRNAKRILVLTENGIAEEGTHDELMKQNGVYTRLYQSGNS